MKTIETVRTVGCGIIREKAGAICEKHGLQKLPIDEIRRIIDRHLRGTGRHDIETEFPGKLGQ